METKMNTNSALVTLVFATQKDDSVCAFCTNPADIRYTYMCDDKNFLKDLDALLQQVGNTYVSQGVHHTFDVCCNHDKEIRRVINAHHQRTHCLPKNILEAVRNIFEQNHLN
jgi:hypothetical protein